MKIDYRLITMVLYIIFMMIASVFVHEQVHIIQTVEEEPYEVCYFGSKDDFTGGWVMSKEMKTIIFDDEKYNITSNYELYDISFGRVHEVEAYFIQTIFVIIMLIPLMKFITKSVEQEEELKTFKQWRYSYGN